MKRVFLIRHAQTAGNRERRYIGRTDEPITEQARRELLQRKVPPADLVAVSPLLRCRETAELLYPDAHVQVVPELAECDFGDFEGRNWQELSDRPDYRAWVDSGGTLPFPNGENPAAFRKRCVRSFLRVIGSDSCPETVAFVVHGGTIMSVLAEFGVPKGEFYSFSVPNGQGYAARWEDDRLNIEGKIWEESSLK